MLVDTMKKMKVYVPSEHYLSEKNHDSDWCEEIPVDLNGGFVPVDKLAPDNLKKVEENIKRRFVLGGEE